MNIEQAKKIPLELVMQEIKAVETKSKSDRSEIWYQSPFHEDKTASFKIDTKKCYWKDWGTGKGGDVIKLVCEYNQMTVSEALKWLKKFEGVTLPENKTAHPARQKTAAKHKAEPVNGLLKEKEITNGKLCQYIGERGLPVPLVRDYCREVSFKNSESGKMAYGIGMENNAGGWEVRGAIGGFKAVIGNKAITTICRQKNKVAVEKVHIFEGFIDFLTKENKWPSGENEATIILNSASLIAEGIEEIRTNEKLKEAKNVRLWLDNDTAGDRATQEMADQLHEVYEVGDMRRIYADYKDFNEYWTESPEARKSTGGVHQYDDTATGNLRKIAESHSKPKF